MIRGQKKLAGRMKGQNMLSREGRGTRRQMGTLDRCQVEGEEWPGSGGQRGGTGGQAANQPDDPMNDGAGRSGKILPGS